MIDQLNEEQTRSMETIKKKWIAHYLGGDDHMDEKAIRDGISWMYGISKLAPPRVFILDSPFACQCALQILRQVREPVWEQVGEQVRQVRGQVRGQVSDQVWEPVGEQVGRQVWKQVRGQVWKQVGKQVSDQVWEQVGRQVWYQVRGQAVKDEEEFALSDLFDCGWAAWFDFFKQWLTFDEKAHRYIRYLQAGSFLSIQLQGAVFVSRRPCRVQRDAMNRLHCADEMAIRWRDGTGYYFWHGVAVPEKLILHPDRITAKDMESQKNSEVMRAIAEKLGWEEYARRMDVFLVDKFFDVRSRCHYELWDFKKRFELTPRLLKMESPELKDGSRPHYTEPVDPGLWTCESAIRWQCDPARPSVEECNKAGRLLFEREE